jgi:PAS domain S-box-containing protein
MAAPRAHAARDIWWLFLFILIADTFLVSLNISRSARNEADVAHTLKVITALEQLGAALTDTETGARGFVIAGTDEFLQQYRNGLPQIDEFVEDIRRLTPDNLNQQQRLAALAPLIDRRLTMLQSLVAVRQQPIRDSAREVELVTAGKQNMDNLRKTLGEMGAEERRLLDIRRDVAQSTLTTSIYSAIVGGALTVGMLILANFLIRREREVRRRSEEYLRQNEERFRIIAESLPQFVWVTGPDGHFEYCNRRWLDYSGLATGQSLGYGWNGPLHPDDREQFEKLWKHSLMTGEPFETETRFQRSQSESRWFLVRVMPLRNRAGKIERWLGTASDIDDQKRANEALESRVRERTVELQTVIADLYTEARERERATEQLNQTAAELARSNKELEQFAYLASHDLQEPLRKIQSFGDRLKMKFASDIAEPGREYIDRMQSSAARMRRLIDDLLAFSRVSTRPLPFEDVDLNVVAQEVLGDLEDALQRTGARVDVGPLPTIRADAMQMRQLFQNLLTNSLKFHRPHEPPHVTISAATLARMPTDSPDAAGRMAVRIDIADNGIGFDNEYRDRIFEVFQRLHGRTEYEGTGIGLAVVRKIAERHGGTVTANGEPGGGATFSVILPMNEPVDQQRDGQPPAAAHVASK